MTHAARLPVGLVAAVGRNGVIGVAGALPWRLRSDLRHFKALTLGKPVIMGRKTFDSIGRVLPGRRSLVVSRSASLCIEGAEVVGCVAEALDLAQRIGAEMGAGEIAVAGGSEIFAATIDVAAALHITEVDGAPDGDVYFPEIDARRWREMSREAHAASAHDEAAFSFVEYARR